jgi:hypothetical protein
VAPAPGRKSGADMFDSLQSNTAIGSGTTGCIFGGGVQAYGSNLRIGTLGCSERALGYSEPAKLLTPEGAAARLRGVGITKCMGEACVAPKPSESPLYPPQRLRLHNSVSKCC